MSACRPDEWVDVVDWIRDRWPRSREWSDPKPKVAPGELVPGPVTSRAETLYPDFERIPAKAIWKSLRAWYDVGKGKPPTADQLRAAAKAEAKNFIPEGADPADPTWCNHNFSWWPPEDGYVTGICTRCKTEQTVLASQPTEASLDETVDVF